MQLQTHVSPSSSVKRTSPPATMHRLRVQLVAGILRNRHVKKSRYNFSDFRIRNGACTHQTPLRKLQSQDTSPPQCASAAEAAAARVQQLRLLRRRVCQLETPGPSTRATASRRPLTAVVRLIELGEVVVYAAVWQNAPGASIHPPQASWRRMLAGPSFPLAYESAGENAFAREKRGGSLATLALLW